MSTLTKLFVVLLVVLSMLMTASVVVFVHRVENSYAKATAATERANAEAAPRQAAAASEASARGELQNLRNQFNNQTTQMAGQITALQQEVADRDVRLAAASSQSALQSADLSRLTEGLKASEDTKSKLQDQIVDLRKTSDDLVRRTSELNATVSDLTNRLEVTERDRRYGAEQLTEAQNQNARLSAAVKDAGINMETAQPGTRGGAPAINGVVRDTRDIAGIKYATISVGSADSVAKGMEFNIIDRERGDFLGILTVDTVEANEATGRLRGPRVEDVQAAPKCALNFE